MSAQRVKEMLERFQVQEKIKQEILERERQLKRLETQDDEVELKKNIHKKYLRTKYKSKHGHSRWEAENYQEVVEKMYERRHEKPKKQQKNDQLKAAKFEAELKTYFKPQTLTSAKSWENLKKNEKRINSRMARDEQQKQEKRQKAIDSSKERFLASNKNTVYQRMQYDLDERKGRDKKRKQLKKFKDIHYKDYCKIMKDYEENDDEGESPSHV
jgi:hypothetical protein